MRFNIFILYYIGRSGKIDSRQLNTEGTIVLRYSEESCCVPHRFGILHCATAPFRMTPIAYIRSFCVRGAAAQAEAMLLRVKV